MTHMAIDIGNVIFHFDIEGFKTKLSKILYISRSDVQFFLDWIHGFHDAGITTFEKAIEHDFGPLYNNKKEILEAWDNAIYPNSQVVSLLKTLKEVEGVKIAYLSNIGYEHALLLKTKYSEIFSNSILHFSFEIGAIKPSKLFFQSFCLDHDEFSGCVYIDDLENNLKTAKQYGFTTYQFNLNNFSTLSQSKQKIELDQMKALILSR